MAIQTEVTLQPDYILSACEGEKSQSIAKIVILSPAQHTPMVKSSTIILVVLIFSEQISTNCMWSSGTTLSWRSRRFGSREFKPLLAQIFF